MVNEHCLSPHADQAAARSVRRYMEAAGDEALVAATWHHTIPAAIIEDRNLNSADIHTYIVLKHCISMNGHGKPATMPSYSRLAEYIGHRSTISASLTVLRATRWITGIKRRSPKGQFATTAYIVHDRPLDPSDVMSLDLDYPAFMATAHRHPSKRVRTTCARLTELMIDEIERDVHYLEPSTPARQLAETLHQNCQIHARANTKQDDPSTPTSVDNVWTNNLVRNPYQVSSVDTLGISDRVRIPHSASDHPVRIPNTDFSEEKTDTYDQVRNPYSVQQRCCLKEKTTTTNSTTNSPQPSDDAVHVPDYAPPFEHEAQGLHADLSPGEAQYLDYDPLTWPDCIGRKHQQLLRPLLVAKLSLQDAQQLLDDLRDRIARGLASNNPIKNPVGYLRGMLKHGYTPQKTTAPTDPPSTPTAQPPGPVTKKTRSPLTEAQKQQGRANAQAIRSAIAYREHRHDWPDDH